LTYASINDKKYTKDRSLQQEFRMAIHRLPFSDFGGKASTRKKPKKKAKSKGKYKKSWKDTPDRSGAKLAQVEHRPSLHLRNLGTISAQNLEYLVYDRSQ